MSKHTPGPWKIAQQYKDEANYPIGAYRIGTDKRDGHDVAVVQCVYREANARLIAAAPELLLALKELLQTAPAFLPESADKWAIDDYAEALKNATKAIAKAEGTD